MESGSHTSGASTLVPTNPSGATPATVTGRLLRRTTAPTIDGSASKRRRHRRSLMTATALGSVTRSSAGRKNRPRAGVTPSTVK